LPIYLINVGSPQKSIIAILIQYRTCLRKQKRLSETIGSSLNSNTIVRWDRWRVV